MILTSIAMEELALSHIMNAEGEKLQYVLKHFESHGDAEDFAVDKILAVNSSVANLLDSVSQNQMLLKGKMEKALNALSNICPEQKKDCKKKCSAAFNAKCVRWCSDHALSWNNFFSHGNCVRLNPDDSSKIEINKKGRYMVNFSVTVKGNYKSDIAVSLQTADKKIIFTTHGGLPRADSKHTVSMSGVLLEISEAEIPFPLFLRLVSSDHLTAETALINIFEI